MSFVGVSILLLSTILLLNFGTVLTLWHFLFFILWFNLLVGRYMSYHLCLCAYNDVHHIWCCVFCFVCLRLVSCAWWCLTHMVLCFLFCLSSSCVLCMVVSNTYGVVFFALFVFVLCLVYPMLPVFFGLSILDRFLSRLFHMWCAYYMYLLKLLTCTPCPF